MKQLTATAVLLLLLLAGAGLTAMQPAKKADLKLNLKKGSKFAIEQTSEQVVKQEMMGMDVGMTIGMGMTYDMEVTGVKDKNYIIKSTYSRVNTKMTSAFMTMEYDSDNPEAGNEMIAEYIKPLLGQTLTLTVSPEGSIEKIDGLEELGEKMGNANGTTAAVAGTMSPEGMQEAFKGIWMYLPGRQVAVGESWKKDAGSGGDDFFTANNTYTLKEIKGNTAVIDISGDSKVDTEQQGVSMKLTGSTTGSMQVDLSTGMFTESSYTQTMSGEGNSPQVEGSCPISISSKVSLKVLKQ